MIDDSISILSFAEGEFYHVQFISSSTITSWAISDGELPDGMTLATDGVLSGTPTLASAGSVYKATVEATVSGGGTETLDITIGVKLADSEANGAPDWNFSLDSNSMIFPSGFTDEETGLPLTKLKQTDNFVISLGLLKGGVTQDVDAANFRLKVKQIEGEIGVDTETGFLQKIGFGNGFTRYKAGVEFVDALFDSFLSDDEEDVDTNVRLVADLTVQYWQDAGAAEPILNSRTSSPFHIELSRKL